MGTSLSQGSPGTTNWNAVAATYRSEAVPVDRVVQEVWRAAQSEIETDWQALLGAPIIATCLDIAVRSETPSQALTVASREIARARESSLATEVAKRAIVQSFAGEDRPLRFVQALFAEASNYLVSRDLPAYVGSAGRNRTIEDAIHFKDLVRQRVMDVVGTDVPPGDPTIQRWPEFVMTTARRLAGREL